MQISFLSHLETPGTLVLHLKGLSMSSSHSIHGKDASKNLKYRMEAFMVSLVKCDLITEVIRRYIKDENAHLNDMYFILTTVTGRFIFFNDYFILLV